MTAIWSSALSRLSSKIAPQTYDMWLRPIECASIDGNRILLRVPNNYLPDWPVENHYLAVMLDEPQARGQPRIPRRVRGGRAAADGSTAGSRADARRGIFGRDRRGRSRRCGRDHGRNDHDDQQRRHPPVGPEPAYTFDKFVVGPTNQFAHAAARMVAEAPASRWNPLFIYGGVGLGKTHLLQAIGHEIHRSTPSGRSSSSPARSSSPTSSAR